MKEGEKEEIENFLLAHAHRSPNLIDQAKNLNKAALRVAKAALTGQRVKVQKEELDYRLSVCRGCHLWDEGGNVGLGKCNHPGCGCTKLKHGLATEKCPLFKWNYKSETSNNS